MYIYIAACLLLPETYVIGLCCCLSSVYISRIKYFEMYPQLVCLGNAPPPSRPDKNQTTVLKKLLPQKYVTWNQLCKTYTSWRAVICNACVDRLPLPIIGTRGSIKFYPLGTFWYVHNATCFSKPTGYVVLIISLFIYLFSNLLLCTHCFLIESGCFPYDDISVDVEFPLNRCRSRLN